MTASVREASDTPKKLLNAGETWVTFRIPDGRDVPFFIFGSGVAATPAAATELGGVFTLGSFVFGFVVVLDLGAVAGTVAEDLDGAKRVLQALKTLKPLLNPEDIVTRSVLAVGFRRRV